MNRAQCVVTSVGCFIIAIMGAYPPWHIQTPTTRIGDVEFCAHYQSLGYALILIPPMRIDVWKPVPWTPPPESNFFERAKQQEAFEEERYGRNATIDIQRLAVQWFIVASLTLGIVVLLGMPRALAATATKPIVGTSVKSDVACGSDVHAQV